MDSLEQFKKSQKQSWASFIPFEFVTTRTAAHLVRFAEVLRGQHLLDVGYGTDVVAITAAQPVRSSQDWISPLNSWRTLEKMP